MPATAQPWTAATPGPAVPDHVPGTAGGAGLRAVPAPPLLSWAVAFLAGAAAVVFGSVACLRARHQVEDQVEDRAVEAWVMPDSIRADLADLAAMPGGLDLAELQQALYGFRRIEVQR